MYVTRNYEKYILNINKILKVLLINSTVESGKTTFLKQIADADRKYVDL